MNTKNVSDFSEKKKTKKKVPSMEESEEWYRLDNAATVFTHVNSRRITCLFRLSCELKKPVNVTILQEALENIMRRFPYYQVHLKRGLFWYYWEKNPKKPKIEKEVRNISQKLSITEKNTFPFRVRVYQKRVAVEFHHSLTDGTGALTFLRALIAEYLTLQGVKVENYEDIFRPNQKPDLEEYEDGYKKNYSEEVPQPARLKNAFQITNKLEEKGKYHVTTGIIPLKEILAKSKSLNVTLTEYLIAIYLDALQEILWSYPEKKRKKLLKPIRITVPVNLRRIFPSKTMRNFSLFVIPGIDPRLGKYSFEEILKIVYHYMRVEVCDKFISQQLARNVRGELNPLVRYAPLPIKKIFGRVIYNLFGERLYSGVLTNLGIVKMPEELEEKIENFHFLPAPSPANKSGCAIVSFKDKLYINFGRVIKDPIVERHFFRRLVQDNIPVKIETN